MKFDGIFRNHWILKRLIFISGESSGRVFLTRPRFSKCLKFLGRMTPYAQGGTHLFLANYTPTRQSTEFPV